MTGKSVHWRRDPKILERLSKVERRHLRGDTNVAIADDLGVDEITVRRDIQRLRELWLERVQEDQETIRAQVVANLEDVRRRALSAAEFDQRAERAVLYGEDEDGRVLIVERDAKGSAQFRGQKAQSLNVARQAAMDQAKVMGVIVDKVAPTDEHGKSLSMAQVREALGLAGGEG